MLKHSQRATFVMLAASAIGVGIANDALAQQSSAAAQNEIRAAADAFVESFNQKDAAAIAAHWTEDGVYINEDGQRFEGRKAIQQEYEMLFANSPDELRMKLEIDSIRLVTPDTAIEEGRAALVPQPTGENRVMSQYTAVHVKGNGKWLTASVRDTRVELPPEMGQLEDLAWLVGTWVSGDRDDNVITRCRWIENQHFLARSHSVTASGKVTAAGLQIIGVDPSTGQITSWSFTNDGGHAVGLWTPHDNGWIVQSSGVMRDGTPTSATHTLSRQDQDTLLWKSSDRTLGEALLPDAQEIALKRR